MNAFKCKVTGDVGTQPLGKPALPRRCGADPSNGRPDATPGNCTVGAKWPMYWYQKEGNNVSVSLSMSWDKCSTDAVR